MMLLALTACMGAASPAPDPVAPVPAAAVTPVSAPQVAPAEAPSSAIFTPRTIYRACRDRVELPEAAAECTSDADCVSAGCSKEVCTTKSAAASLTTTCEVQDCFAVLDTCGCTEGVCAWSLHMPEGMLKPVPGLTPGP